MVVRIKSGKSIRGALSYNEQKVRQGSAEIILAAGFSCEVNDLGFSEKLRRFQLLNERNPRVKTNTLHLSLNFPPGEILAKETMQQIAMEYMDRIGFSGQPFLVYEHSDANHPHFHIVTTTIRDNGETISLHNIGRELSEPARKALELQYGLTQAESVHHETIGLPDNSDLVPALYGKAKTKHAITNIIGEVIRTYQFGTLEELNLILRQFNVVADRGQEGGQMYQKGGLVYSLLDTDGFRSGVSIKSSAIYGKPTLKTLTRLFATNKVKKVARKESVRKSVEVVFSRNKTPQELVKALLKRKIGLHFDKDITGNIQAVQFVDHFNKAVFSHDELGLELKTVLERLAIIRSNPGQSMLSTGNARNAPKGGGTGKSFITQFMTPASLAIINSLLSSGPGGQESPIDFPKKKKKKKKGPSL
jgi:hypothetical protein